ncbi:esterase/lipase family protein [Arthrobacter crystallopoietes]|uniref:esterase/lipase family protein n=1 Tax=Crystallibacter crystallopoietes TaxID=37928 RepID=UPI001F0F0DCC|nr:alpha/beta fold hydrolase [Arthrobacter crystallopoietes]
MTLSRGWAWLQDYAYVAYWQVHGFLFRDDPAPYLQAAGREDQPVLLIPGIYEKWQFLKPIADDLRQAGHPVHVVEPLGYNRGTVAKMAELVSAYLAAANLQNVTIVAHSKGGLIGKYAMTMPGAAGRIARMVAINTPFSGSVYARFFLVPSIRALSPSNSALRSLAAELSVNHRITSVYSSFDPHIPGGSELPGAENIELDLMGHFRIIGDSKVLKVIRSVLSGKGASGN